jgi:hypothetical protein
LVEFRPFKFGSGVGDGTFVGPYPDVTGVEPYPAEQLPDAHELQPEFPQELQPDGPL